MKCRCREIQRISGNDGEYYARDHLKKLTVDLDTWQVLYQCPETGHYWKKYSPHPELQGGGPPEFVQIPRELAEEEFEL